MSRFCINCKHYLYLNSSCLLANKKIIDLVTSRVTTNHAYASRERDSKYSNCGSKGELYEYETSAFMRLLNKYPYTPFYIISGGTIGSFYGIIISNIIS